MGQALPHGFFDLFSVAALPSNHPGAFVERGGKAIKATTQQGFLCYGQYKEGYPLKTLQAVFSLLVDNNTHDDAYVLILDVYDHQSDRLVAKRLLTRKDFPTANDFCVFTFNFTPPSPQARMEFRIYYMGYAYVLADKIAVIDPTQVSIQDADQLPAIDVPIVPPPITPPGPPIIQAPNISPWKIKQYGEPRGKITSFERTKHEIKQNKGELWYGANIGVEMTGRGNELTDVAFLYVEVQQQFGFFKQWAHFSSYDGHLAGIMLRESLNPDSKFLLVEPTRILCRNVTNGPIDKQTFPHSGSPSKVRVILSERPGQSYDVTIEFRNAPTITAAVSFEVGRHYYSGIALGTFRGAFELGSKYKDMAYKTGN